MATAGPVTVYLLMQGNRLPSECNGLHPLSVHASAQEARDAAQTYSMTWPGGGAPLHWRTFAPVTAPVEEAPWPPEMMDAARYEGWQTADGPLDTRYEISPYRIGLTFMEDD